MQFSLPRSSYLRASITMVLAMVAFVTNDTLVKYFAAAVPIGELVAVRGAFATIFLFAICAWQGALSHVKAGLSAVVMTRAGLDLLATLAFIAALMHMPIANLTAIIQAVPLAVTALGALFLGERVGWRRTLSVTAGFVGVLLIARPAPATFTIYDALALSIVLLAAVRDVITRRIPGAVPSSIVALANAVCVTAGGLALGAVEGFIPLAISETLGLAAAAVFVAMGYVFMVLALRLGDLSATAPFRYTIILFAMISGIFVFGETPDRWALGGIGLIVAAGIYTLRREAKLARVADASVNG